MNIYTTILAEFLLISSCILLLFKLRSKLGLAPLYILLGSVQYLQALSGSMVSFNLFGEIPIYPGSVIIFSAVLFAVLLIYIKEGVTSARGLILGIIISNIILSVLFRITYVQEFATQIISIEDSSSVFQINYEYFITGTLILLVDFILLVIIYQFLISKISKRYFFFALFISLFSVLLYDAFAFNIILKYDAPDFKVSLLGHIIGKTISAFIFSLILYIYLKFIDVDKNNSSFIANQNQDIFSIFTYRKKYLKLKVQKKLVEQKLTSQLEMSLNNISDGFVSLDTNWCYTYINNKAAEFLGVSAESLIGKHIWTEFPEGVGLPFYNAYHKAFETQQTIYFEDFYEPFDKWFENRIYPSNDGLTIYFTDITDKKKADINNQMLLSLIETSDDFVGLANLEGKPIYLNANGRKLVGLDANEKTPTSISDFFPENYQDKIVNDHMPNIFKNNKWNGEAQFQNFKTGEPIPIEMSGFLINDTTTNKPIALGIVATDITERKKAEEQLINSEQLFRRLSSNAPVAIFQTDKEGSCNYVNEEWMKYSGMSFEAAMGFGWTNAIHPDDKERVMNEVEQSIVAGTENVSEFRFQNPKKQTTWLSTKTVELYDTENKLNGYIGMAIDITERKKAEEQIIKSEKYLENIINNIGDPVFVKDDQSHFLLANEAFYNLFNRTKEEIHGKTFADDVPQEERESYLRNDHQVISKGIENVVEDSVYVEGGETRFISTKKTRFIDESGEKFIIGTIRDITKSKKAEEQIIKSEKYLENIINNIGDPVFVKDDQSHMILVNDALCEIFNLSRADMIGKTLAENVPPEEMESFLRIDKQVISTGIENINEETLTMNENETRIISTKKTRFIDDSGNKFLIGIIRDITERKKAEEEIRKAHQRLTTHLNNSPLGIIEWDKNFIIRNWSVQAKDIFGWEEAEVIGKHFNDLNLVYEEEIAATKFIVDELMNGKVKSNRIINRNYTKTNKIIYCEWYNSVLRSADGQIETMFSLVQDITERQKNEETIKESEEKFSNAFRSNVMGLAILNRDNKIIEINDALLQTLETTRDEIVVKTSVESGFFNFIEEGQFELRESIWARLRTEGHIQNVEVSITLTSGKKLVLILSMEPIDLLGEPHILVTSNDVTEKKKAEEGQIHLTNIIEQSLNEIYVFDADTMLFEYVNSGAIKNIGYSMEEMANMTPLQIKPDFTEAKWRELLVPLKSAEKTKLEFETRHLRKDKSSYPVEIHLQRIEQQDKGVYLAVILDITERKMAEAELKKHRHHLEELVELRTSELEKEKVKAQSADLMKSAFLATMSHELRTPMNSIIGFTGILIKEFAGPLNDEQKKQLGMVKNSGEHLLGLINDILDISKIEAGKLKVTYYPFSYLKSLEKTVDFLIPQASAKDLKLVTQIDEMDITLISDERRVEQILLNLLSNAIKFSKEGTILVKVAVKDDMLITQVIDEGIGISKKNLVKLFMPFIQLEAGLSRRHEGTGLGLAISKNLIEKLGGTIHVDSQLGKGSNFTFKLPLEYSENN